MQNLLDALGAAVRDSRSGYHLTLGEAIKKLTEFSDGYVVVFDKTNFSPGDEMSYRGYYSDLAFTFSEGEPKTVGEFAHQLRGALGQEYTGYKGGEFRMDAATPLWVSGYGENSGIAIMSMHFAEDRVIIVTKKID